jgi:hypothetical protein
MPSETNSSSPRGLLADVARATRPFLYRTTVYRLLGARASDDGAIKHAAPLPPVGFRYLARGAPGWFPSSAPAGETWARRPATPDRSALPVGTVGRPAPNARFPERVPRPTAATGSAEDGARAPVLPASHAESTSVVDAGVSSDQLRPMPEAPQIDTRLAEWDVDGRAALRHSEAAGTTIVSAPPRPVPPVTPSLPADPHSAGAPASAPLALLHARQPTMPREPSRQSSGPRAQATTILTGSVGAPVDDHGQATVPSAPQGPPSARPIEQGSMSARERPRASGDASAARTLIAVPTPAAAPSTIDESAREGGPVALQPRPRSTLSALPYRQLARTAPDVVAATASRPDRTEARSRVADPEPPRRPSQRLVPIPTARSLLVVPRSFWASSGMRSRHLGVLR